MRAQIQDMRHEYIRYANCWEDADLLLEGLEIKEGDRVLSIGSAGDNSFSLLTRDPEFVIAVDINPVQLQLIELKKAAFLSLDHEAFLRFLGFRPADDREQLFEKVKNHLDKTSQKYWGEHFEDIEGGIIHTGKFERYFHIFRTYILPLIHSSSTIDRLFTSKSAEEQKQFYNEKWDNWRWRALFKVFFSKTLMSLLGREPAFFKEVEVPVSQYLLSQAEKHLSSIHSQNNYFLHYIMKGDFGERLPHYARMSNFDKIRNNLDRLRTMKGKAEDALLDYEGINKFNLSDIFEYMDKKQFQEVGRALSDNAETGSRYVYWNLMVSRELPDISDRLQHAYEATGSPKVDVGFFYSSVHIDEKL